MKLCIFSQPAAPWKSTMAEAVAETSAVTDDGDKSVTCACGYISMLWPFCFDFFFLDDNILIMHPHVFEDDCLKQLDMRLHSCDIFCQRFGISYIYPFPLLQQSPLNTSNTLTPSRYHSSFWSQDQRKKYNDTIAQPHIHIYIPQKNHACQHLHGHNAFWLQVWPWFHPAIRASLYTRGAIYFCRQTLWTLPRGSSCWALARRRSLNDFTSFLHLCSFSNCRAMNCRLPRAAFTQNNLVKF